MSPEDAPTSPAPTKQAKPRVSGDSRYPSFDLNSSLILARAVKEKGGNACTPEQLGGYMGVKNARGGSFVGRVASARMFGLIQTVQGRYQTTERAEAIMYPVTNQTRDQALRDAFLGVPLFRQVYERHRGQRLPEGLGMRNLLHIQYEIPSGDRVVTACRVMMDSAETAGFFQAHNGARTHLVDPITGAPAYATPRPTVPTTGEPGTGSGGGGGGDEGGGDDTDGGRVPHDIGHDAGLQNLDLALRGLLRLVPPRGDPWPDKKRWSTIWASTLDLLYPENGRKKEGQ